MGLLDKVKAQATAATEWPRTRRRRARPSWTRSSPRRRPTACSATSEPPSTPPRQAGPRPPPTPTSSAWSPPSSPRGRARPPHTGARDGCGRTDGHRHVHDVPGQPRGGHDRTPGQPRAGRPRQPAATAPTPRRLNGRPGRPSAGPGRLSSFAAGWSSLVARRAHNPKVGGSNPPPATIRNFHRSPPPGSPKSVTRVRFKHAGVTPSRFWRCRAHSECAGDSHAPLRTQRPLTSTFGQQLLCLCGDRCCTVARRIPIIWRTQNFSMPGWTVTCPGTPARPGPGDCRLRTAGGRAGGRSMPCAWPGALGDHELLADGGVGPALRHESEYLGSRGLSARTASLSVLRASRRAITSGSMAVPPPATRRSPR